MMTVEALRHWLAKITDDDMLYGAIREPLLALFAERDRLAKEAETLIVRCQFCNMRATYKTADEETAWSNLAEHLRTCTSHPMRALEAENAFLRKLLVGAKDERQLLQTSIKTMWAAAAEALERHEALDMKEAGHWLAAMAGQLPGFSQAIDEALELGGRK